MGVEYRIAGKRLTLVSGDHFDTETLRLVMSKAIQDPAFDPPMDLLADFTLSKESASQRDLLRRASLAAAASNLFRRIAVVAGDDLRFGLARIGAAFAEARDLHVEVFRELSQAEAYLDGSA